jgi:hypothetical protein
MKRTIKISLFSTALILSLSACTTTRPLEVTSNNGPTAKVGEATCKSYFNFISIGDCGYEAAKQNAGITKVHHTDKTVKDFFIFKSEKTQVYGE